MAEALDYENAEKNCNRINGILFEPKSNEENTNVYQTFSEVLHSQVWIGINDKGGVISECIFDSVPSSKK